jgi:hypothetical protein
VEDARVEGDNAGPSGFYITAQPAIEQDVQGARKAEMCHTSMFRRTVCTEITAELHCDT